RVVEVAGPGVRALGVVGVPGEGVVDIDLVAGVGGVVLEPGRHDRINFVPGGNVPARSEDGTGVEDAVRVEGVLDAPGQGDDIGADLVRQPGLLQAAHAVFAGDGAAEGDGQVHDLAEGPVGASGVLGVGRVVDDQRMGVAVTRVRDDR